MFMQVFKTLKQEKSNDSVRSKRKSPRREIDTCVAVIDGITYPVENWSMGGMLIHADERFFAVDQTMPITVKFKLRNKIKSVSHRGRIVRKTNGMIAIAFEKLTVKTKRGFQRVIDDYVAREFANSQG